jgi:hypothetical protein
VQLTSCASCAHSISATALACPACGCPTRFATSTPADTKDAAKTVAKFAGVAALAAVAVALGPAAFIVGAVAGVSGHTQRRQIKQCAEELGAIDAFPLGTDWIVFVTRMAFVRRWIMGLEGPGAVIPLDRLGKVYVDRSKSFSGRLLQRDKAVLVVEEPDATSPSRFESNSFELRGTHAARLADLACLKYEEYRLPAK